MASGFIQEIFKELNLSQREVAIIASAIKKMSVRKGDLISNEGQSGCSLYFVNTGCLRTYFVYAAGKEYTLEFATNGCLITDYSTLFADEFAVLTIECLQDAVVYQLPKENLKKLYKQIPQIEKFYNERVEKSLIAFQKRLLSTIVQSAQERYMMFVKMYPNINKMVKNYHIASYLGITPESLSRVIKNIYAQ